jgi:hypothetical protein
MVRQQSNDNDAQSRLRMSCAIAKSTDNTDSYTYQESHEYINAALDEIQSGTRKIKPLRRAT